MKQIDEIMDKAQYLFDVAGRKTGDLIELSRIKIRTTQLKSNIDSEFKKLGSIFYKMKRENYSCEKRVDEICYNIDILFDELDRLEGKISDMQDTKICNCCNAKNPEKAEYCFNCGAHISDKFYDYDPEDDDFNFEKE